MNRRDILKYGAGIGLGLALPTPLLSQTPAELKYPPLLDTSSSGAFDLKAQAGFTRFTNGASSPTMGFNQPYLGPTIRLRTSAETRASVQNTLDEPLSVHWHGLLVPGNMDGGPHQAIRPGETWRPVLALDQPTTTAWYHSHVHGATARHVMYGLAGVLHVSDGADDDRGLPSTYGVDDLTLVLQDRRFNFRGRMAYGANMRQSMDGFKGDTLLVNGQIGGTAIVPKGIVRCRLVNGSNARIYSLAMSDNRPLHLVATDGGLVPAPVALKRLTLAPGERCEVLIDFNDTTDAVLMSDSIANSAMNGMMSGARRSGPFPVLPFSVDASRPSRMDRIPEALDGDLPDLPLADASTRRISLDMGMGMGMMMSRSSNQFSINSAPFDQKRLNFSVSKDAVERWVVRGDLMMHPFHVHGVRFQVLTENGQPPKAQNRGWKDTVLVQRHVELAMRFDKTATAKAPYMYHCHILEHEDGGMMGQFSVT